MENGEDVITVRVKCHMIFRRFRYTQKIRYHLIDGVLLFAVRYATVSGR